VSPRRWFFGLFTLLLLLILGWLGWAQWQFTQRQAAAPVVSVAEDGTVRVNGREIVMPHDGLPPKVLEEMEGGPPVETPQRFPEEIRLWRYPRLGLTLVVENVARAGDPVYIGHMKMGHDRWSFPATLEFRGQRWWLGPPGLLGPQRQRHLAPDLRAADGTKATTWQPQDGNPKVSLDFHQHLPLERLGSDLFSSFELRGAIVELPTASGTTPAAGQGR